ncbi:MAG: methyltransferase domain-containing protein [Victivallales bacterium]|nr:methyltransferase domain-containing protein [Victivallales bacterium]MCF7889400.1 methyltransferase domain-containing protein [Victivallales bacterium]
MSIKTVFDNHSEDYDSLRRNLIPCFDDFYRTAIEIIPFNERKNIKVLDLGAGTGIMSEMIALKYPESEITLIDLSNRMLNIAKRRLSKFNNRIKYIEQDYSIGKIEKTYDLIISSLSIHHLDKNEKKLLYRKCFNSLTQDGVLINADQVLGETAEIDKIYRDKWIQDVKNNGVSEEELSAALDRMKEDKMSTLLFQTTCLKNSGFCNVNCWYKNFSFAVFSGQKKKKQE